MTQNNAIGIDYSDQRLRVLVEEYITQQRGTFSLQGACAYVLYWAMEDGYTTNNGLYESNQLAQSDCDRISSMLQKIVSEGRIASVGEQFEKLMN